MPGADLAEQSSPRLTLDCLVVRSEGFLAAEIDNEIVALSVDKGTCYGLNKTASRIWDLIEGRTRINDICAALVARYAVEPGTCERQVLDLLEDLRAEGLIATSGKA